jgi:predicted ribosome quality control (RQC) complex YloA/Tae2 family protein
VPPPADGFVVTEWVDNVDRPHVRIGLAGTERHPDRQHTRFDTANEAALNAFEVIFADLGPSRRRDTVLKALARQLRRKRRAVTKVEAEIADAERADEYRAKGQLLLARKRDIRRGDVTVTLEDYDGITRVEIELDPRLTPQDNAETYFRRARKAEKRGLRAPERLASLESEIAELIKAVESAGAADGKELDKLEEEFARPVTARGRKAKSEERALYRTYHISGGWEVLVGKANRDNDLLTHRVARPGDLWFHARQVAGSHVVLRIPDGDRRPDKQAILEAAAIAAFHSKAGRSSKVSVSYTEKRHVRKPRGAKPGLAVISREKSVMVRPAIPDSDG